MPTSATRRVGHRLLGDIEIIHTYEGTETMQTLIVGRDITGIGAFA
jgi:glutaryl-CoA dehydrogenase